MSLWEYKVITSGKGGFASPGLLEKFLNDLGKEEWEIVHFQTMPDNALAFTGMARRTTQRDWTLQDAAAAAAKTEAEKLRAEFEAKFKAASSPAAAPGADEKPETIAGEKLAADTGMRRVRDTQNDFDPDAQDEEPKDEWDMLNAEDELPTFFEAIKPHMRRNQRGPGMSVGVEHLAKRWNLADEDVKTAMIECGLAIPEDEDDKPVYVEYEGDLFWLNVNRRGELWLNTKEKPRPVFRTVPAQRVAVEAEEPKPEERRPKPPVSNEHPEPEVAAKEPAIFQPAAREPKPAPAPATTTLPTGPALLEKIRPLMRRNRRGEGGSGSTTFLARGLKCGEADLMSAFASMGLLIPAGAADQPVQVEFGSEVWWLNKDQRGGIWINGRVKSAGDDAPSGTAPQPEGSVQLTEASAPADATPAPAIESPPEATAAPAETAGPTSAVSPATAAELAMPTGIPSAENVLSGVRLLLKETKTGSFAGKLERVAGELGKTGEELTVALVYAGLKIPEKSREKPHFVEHAGEIFWLNRNAKEELWINAKAAKFSSENEESEGEKKGGSRGRTKKKEE
jgi:hypothetical protein